MTNTVGPVPSPEAVGGRRAEHRARAVAGRWGGVAELRADLLPALRFAAVLVLCGLPAGLLWWALAPREDYRVLADGAVRPLGDTSAELFAAADSVFVLVLAGLGLLAGVGGWLLRRWRGVTLLAALAVGPALAGVLAWQLGEVLGPGPTRDELADVGATVTTRLELGSLPALAVAPFVAVLVYVVAALLASGEDLGRTAAEDRPGPPDPAPSPAGPPAGAHRERAIGGGQEGP